MTQGRPLQEILEAIVALVEQDLPAARCSILLLDGSGKRLELGAAPHLPGFYNEAINGIEIGPSVGSCGTAAATGNRTIAEDIDTHPYWAPYRELARRAGLRSCWSEPIVSAGGRVLGTFAIYHDAPATPSAEDLESIAIAAHLASIALEKTRAEETLRASEKKYRDLVETSHDLIWSVDAEGRWTFVNGRGARAIYGYEPEEMLGRPFTEFEAPERHRADLEEFAAVKSGRPTYGFETVHLKKDGAPVTLSFNAIALHDADGKAVGATGTARDITEQRRAEDERRRLESQLQHAQKLESLGLLSGGIAHDFNNLLTSIIGYADLARQDLPEDSEASALITEAIRGARRAAEITTQLLAYSGKGRFVIEPIDLSSLTRDMTRLLEISISKRCAIRYDLAKDLPAVEGDATQFRQVVMNLVINASEAIGDRPGTITIRTSTRECDRAFFADAYLDDQLPAGTYVVLEVRDTGSGMSPETRARIFDPFFTTKFTGRGLGLAAVLGIVRGHRGTIEVQSAVGAGTTMTVLFPASRTAIPASAAREAPASPWVGSGTILVVDDEDPVRAVVSRMLHSIGFDVITAASGRDAIEIFRQHADRVRLVLLDMTMPNMDGEETLAELRKIRPSVVAVLSSGFDQDASARRFAGTPISGFIQKPYTLAEISRTVRAAIEGSGAASSSTERSGSAR